MTCTIVEQLGYLILSVYTEKTTEKYHIKQERILYEDKHLIWKIQLLEIT